LSLTIEDELGTCELSAENPKEGEGLMERVLAPENLRAAYRRVRANKGAPGVDGITVEELAGQLRAQWPAIREQLLAGEYEPKEVRRKELPKPGGGVRVLGIPTVLDRFIEQALLQILQPEWDATFSDQSYGFRPGRSAHAAVERAQGYYREGYRWVVDVDLEKFFDRVNHDKLMALVAERISDWRVKRLIRRYLKAGMSDAGGVTTREEGTPQGGPISPLLRELTSWVQRRLRCYLWKQWGRRGYRELRRRGISRDLAWNTCKSAHGPWRISRSPALSIALPTRYFVAPGLPLLQEVR
jgi:RNA-directed DNA polymerase